MGKFTPGPWTPEKNYGGSAHNIGFWMVQSPHGPISIVSDVLGQKRYRKGNAHLIAAAPELYEACKAMLNALISERIGYTSDHPEWMKQAANAIKKAEGGD